MKFARHAKLSSALTALSVMGGLALLAAVAPSPFRLAGSPSNEGRTFALQYPDPAAAINADDLAKITEHPLFNTDRQRDPPPPATGALVALESYRLAGIIVAGDFSLAMVERKGASSSVTLKTGDSLDGRIVREITSEGIFFAGSEALRIPKISGASVLAPDETSAVSRPASQTGTGG